MVNYRLRYASPKDAPGLLGFTKNVVVGAVKGAAKGAGVKPPFGLDASPKTPAAEKKYKHQAIAATKGARHARKVASQARRVAAELRKMRKRAVACAARVVDGADVDLAALARGPNQVGDVFEL